MIIFNNLFNSNDPNQPYADRKHIWQAVINKLELSGPSGSISASVLENLATGPSWTELIPATWREIYGAMYDEAVNFTVDEQEKVRISKDVHRTFGLFCRNLPHIKARMELRMEAHYQSLNSILVAASHERNYCQGVNFLAAAFLLGEQSERDAFTLLCYILKQRHLQVLFDSRCSSLVEYMKLFEKKLRKHNKLVYTYFRNVGYSPICYAIEWFTTCFIVTNPGVLSSCVIDLILVGCADIMILVGLAVTDLLETRILFSSVEVLQESFKAMVRALDPVLVLHRALSIRVEQGCNALEKMNSNIDQMDPTAEFVDTLRAHITSVPSEGLEQISLTRSMDSDSSHPGRVKLQQRWAQRRPTKRVSLSAACRTIRAKRESHPSISTQWEPVLMKRGEYTDVVGCMPGLPAIPFTMPNKGVYNAEDAEESSDSAGGTVWENSSSPPTVVHQVISTVTASEPSAALSTIWDSLFHSAPVGRNAVISSNSLVSQGYSVDTPSEEHTVRELSPRTSAQKIPPPSPTALAKDMFYSSSVLGFSSSTPLTTLPTNSLPPHMRSRVAPINLSAMVVNEEHLSGGVSPVPDRETPATLGSNIDKENQEKGKEVLARRRRDCKRIWQTRKRAATNARRFQMNLSSGSELEADVHEDRRLEDALAVMFDAGYARILSSKKTVARRKTKTLRSHLADSLLTSKIRATPSTPAVGGGKKKIQAALTSIMNMRGDDVGRAARDTIKEAAVASEAKPQGSAKASPSWLATVVHTSLWLGSLGMVNRTVPGASLTFPDDCSDDSDSVRGSRRSRSGGPRGSKQRPEAC